MTTAIAERKAFSIEPITYPVIAEKIGELAAEYMPLRVDGLTDKAGLKRVHDARIVVRDFRIKVDKRRKELKASALEYGREVDSAAKQLIDLLEPIESHLQAEEDAVENEKARLKAEADEAKRQKLQKRLDDLLAFGFVGNPANVEAMTDEAHAFHLSTVKLAYDAKVAAEAEAAAQRKAEEARLAADRAELDRLRKEQEAEAARLRAEQKRLDDEVAAQKRSVELENAKREAAEKARVETEQRIAREQEEARLAAERKAAQEKADAEAAERLRLKAEAEKPYREKLLAIAQQVDQIEIPFGTLSERVKLALTQCADKVRSIANDRIYQSHN